MDLFAWADSQPAPGPSPATVVPFPLYRRAAFIRRHAVKVSGMSLEAMEKYVAAIAKRQGKALRLKGVGDTAVDQEIAQMRKAIIKGAYYDDDVGEAKR